MVRVPSSRRQRSPNPHRVTRRRATCATLAAPASAHHDRFFCAIRARRRVRAGPIDTRRRSRFARAPGARRLRVTSRTALTSSRRALVVASTESLRERDGGDGSVARVGSSDVPPSPPRAEAPALTGTRLLVPAYPSDPPGKGIESSVQQATRRRPTSSTRARMSRSMSPGPRATQPSLALQWGRRANAAERKTDHSELTSLGSLQWGRRANAAESTFTFTKCTRTSCSFNGAAARTRRRAGRHRHIHEPRSQGFNGAAARTRRRAGLFAVVLLDRPASMGPPRERGGERDLLATDRASVVASMGPPRERGGEHPLTIRLTPNSLALQWGRRANAAESAAEVAASSPVNVLQWGRRANAAERRW